MAESATTMGTVKPSYLSHLDSTTLLPTAWNTREKYTMVELGQNNLQVSYRGAGKNDQDACAVRGNHPIPSICGVFYFEVEVISKGRDGYMGIGLCWENVPLNRLPGWETNSYGYHADDGNSFCQSGIGKPYGPTFTTGDAVGCGINFIDNTVFFTKNGINLGIAFRDLKGTFYPTVGLRTPGEVLLANFGQKPFRFDIDGMMRDERTRLRASIGAYELAPSGGFSMLNSLILSYLVHHGYGATAQSLAVAAGLLTPAGESNSVKASPTSSLHASLSQQLASIKERQRIRELLLDGDMDGAIDLTERLYPSVLAQNPSILFQLKCRKFVEMVRRGSEAMDTSDEWLTQTMIYGQELQDTYFHKLTEQEQAKLEETFSLLAYPDPFRSPVASLLDPSGREAVASALNSAILVHQNNPSMPPLEKLMRQLLVTMDDLTAQGVGAAAFINVRQDFL